ncbi:hypothetical protein Sta7437_3439 [Stanieria cyanosphaera PCC 7437]|uniref:DUF4278 domain-containing protein n=1 Tax=Stanieria cyanosphaera (strain ATCC 29371 / PCC 7437) TaxID=111780 RepID=K9XZ49_STAC7|nr:DUF4278 domain-containing protein [Stanieria cyanosphaera]AFZ36942.1 hypothetical protein Sta7437_3439 [Stanieria cyanosphaera PCC 7437]
MHLTYRGIRYQSNHNVATTTTETTVKYRGQEYQTKRCAEVEVKSVTNLKYFIYRGIAYMNSVSFSKRSTQDNDHNYSTNYQ